MERAIYFQRQKSGSYFAKISDFVSFGKEEKKAPSSSLLGTIIHQGKEVEMSAILVPSCCYPIPGDEIVGVPIQNNLIRIHRVNCPDFSSDSGRFGGVAKTLHWKNSHSELKTYLAAIEFYGTDSKGLLQGILKAINTNFAIDMKQIIIRADGKTLKARLLVYTNGTIMLDKLMKIIKKYKGITEVNRITAIRDYFEIKD